MSQLPMRVDSALMRVKASSRRLCRRLPSRATLSLLESRHFRPFLHRTSCTYTPCVTTTEPTGKDRLIRWRPLPRGIPQRASAPSSSRPKSRDPCVSCASGTTALVITSIPPMRRRQITPLLADTLSKTKPRCTYTRRSCATACRSTVCSRAGQATIFTR